MTEVDHQSIASHFERELISARAEIDRLRALLEQEYETSARIAESFAKDYGPEVRHMAKRIGEVVRRRSRADLFAALTTGKGST